MNNSYINELQALFTVLGVGCGFSLEAEYKTENIQPILHWKIFINFILFQQ